MKFVALLSLATAALALPQHAPVQSNCLTNDRANYIVSRARVYQLKADLAEARAAGEELYGPDFVQYGDSINSLRGDPLGTQVEPDGATYINNTLSAPPLAGINTLAVLYNCTHIFWQWQFLGVGGPSAPVANRIQGFALIEVDNQRETQPVVEQYIEFNSIAWAENTGFTIAPPTTGPYAPPPPEEK